jgi:hypothetical protein
MCGTPPPQLNEGKSEEFCDAFSWAGLLCVCTNPILDVKYEIKVSL